MLQLQGIILIAALAASSLVYFLITVGCAGVALFKTDRRQRALRRSGLALILAIFCAYAGMVVNDTPAGAFDPDTLTIPWLLIFLVSLFAIVRVK